MILAVNKNSQTSTRMPLKELFGDRKFRFIFECSALATLEAKLNEQDFSLEDFRFCLSCEKWFDAAHYIASIEFESTEDICCARCADLFATLNDEMKRDFMRRLDDTFAFYKNELKHWRQS